MRFQAIFLSLVILISLLIGGAKFSSSQSSVETAVLVASNKNTETINNQQSISIFAKDLYSALSGKIALVGDNLTAVNKNLNQNLNVVGQNLNKAGNTIGQNLAVASGNLNKNFSVAKESLAANIDNFFLNISKYTPEDSSENSLLVSNTTLTSKTEINGLDFMGCNLNKIVFSGKAALAKYLDYNFNIFELNTEKRWPIASLSKLMTALVAIEKMDLDKKIMITETAVSTEGTSGEFNSGEVFKLRDLIKAMMVVSSNDAAAAIAENFGGKNFIDEMQKKAAELNMFQTTYLEPTGLSFVNQSTADDLAKLMSYIYFNHPEILEISRQKKVEMLELKSGKPRELISIDKFAGEDDFVGGKTGYIDEADHNLIALFEINGKTVLTIALGTDDSFAETQKLKDLIKTCQ